MTEFEIGILKKRFSIRKLSFSERFKGVHFVDLGESFPTSIYLQNLASIQPRRSLVKFARSPCKDRPGGASEAGPDGSSRTVSFRRVVHPRSRGQDARGHGHQFNRDKSERPPPLQGHASGE